MNLRSSVYVALMCLCLLLPPPPARGQVNLEADNVVILFDDSGSMNDKLASGVRKIDAGKAALKNVLPSLPPTTHIGLVTFRRNWAYNLGAVDRDKLIRSIDGLYPSDGTPLSEYIKKAADRLLDQRVKQFGNGSYRLLIITDGESGDGTAYQSYVREIMARGITINVIGVGMAKDHDLATRVHSYRKADNPGQFTETVRKVFSEIGGQNNPVRPEEVFDLIAGLPDGLAEAAIQALAVTGNHPIGERPRPPDPPKPPAPSPPPQPQQPNSSSQSGSSSSGGCFIQTLLDTLF